MSAPGNSPVSVAVVTGANKGLGLEFTRQLLEHGWHVIAACRKPGAADDLTALAGGADGRLSVEPLDVTDRSSVAAFARVLGDRPVNLLVNNAGVMDPTPGGFTEQGRRTYQAIGDIDYDGWRMVLETNVLGTTRVTEALLANLEASRGGTIAMISSVMGSIAANGRDTMPPGGGIYLYRSSKAALNMVARSLAIDLHGRGITVICLNPGWVRTDMGGPDARLTPKQSVRGMLDVLARSRMEETGSFVSYDGTPAPW